MVRKLLFLEVIIQELCFLDFILKKIWGYFPGEKRQIRNNLFTFVGDNRNMSEQFGSGE